jgi:hypothetical protein
MRSLLVVTLLLLGVANARADVAGVVFVPQGVRGPLAPTGVTAEPPFVPAGTPEKTGEVELGPDRAVALWLGPLDLVRVRYKVGSPIRFARVVGAGGARGRIVEPGITASPGFSYLAQPPGRADVWMIWADKPATVAVERPMRRTGRLAWDAARDALVRWVDKGGELPEIPVAEGTFGFLLHARADALLGKELVTASPQLAKSVTAWRKANAVAGLTTLRPMSIQQLRVIPIDGLDGVTGEVTIPDPDPTDGTSARPFYRLPAAATARKLRFEESGPGVLRIEARALIAQPAAPPATFELTLSIDGRIVERRATKAIVVMAPDPTFPPPAFPARVPLRAEEGDFLGERVTLSIPLPPGDHDYELAIAGSPVALRVTAARPRVRIGDALHGDHDVETFVKAGRQALGSDRSAGAQLLRRLLDATAGAKPAKPEAIAGGAGKLVELALLARGGGDPATTSTRASALLAGLPRNAPPELVWSVVIELVRTLRERGVPDAELRALLVAARSVPPAELVPELLTVLPATTPLERIRSWAVAALDVAWRENPIDPAIERAYESMWRTSEWALVSPARPASGELPPASLRWLVEAPQPLPGELPRAFEPDPKTLWRLPLGQKRRVVAAPSPIDPARAALLDVYVVTTPDAPGPITLVVDGKSFHTLGAEPVERIQVAVAPGVHELRLEAPASARAWQSLPPAPGQPVIDGKDTARVRTYYPTRSGTRSIRYPLPAEDLPGPLSIGLRAISRDRPPGPIKVRVRTDAGMPRDLTFEVGPVDATAHPLDREDATGEVTFVMRPPPSAKTIWFETDGKTPLYVSLAVRRDVAPPPVVAPAVPPAPESVLEQIATTSRALAANPGDARALVKRANHMLDLGEPDLARQDLMRLVRVPVRKADRWRASAEDELVARLEAWTEPTHIVMTAATNEPVPVAPGMLVAKADALAPWLPTAVALRTRGAAAALELIGRKTSDPIGGQLAARAYTARGDDASAGLALLRVYLAQGAWQIGFDALAPLYRALLNDTTPPGLAAIAFGLATRLRLEVDDPRLRRTLLLSAAFSKWDTLIGGESNAGQEYITSGEPAQPPSPLAATRAALLAPPWPARAAHSLTAGNAATLDLTLAKGTTARAELYCVKLRVGDAPDAPCSFAAKVDNANAKTHNVKAGTRTEISLGSLGAGRHVVEIQLAEAGEDDLASVRFLTDQALPGITLPAEQTGRFPIKIERRQATNIARANQPQTITVLGPTTLWVQARAVNPDANPTTLDIIAEPAKGERVKSTTVLATDRDLEARGDPGRDIKVSLPVDAFLVLPEGERYKITVKPSRGEAAIRMARRDDKKGKIPRPPGPWYVGAAQPARPFALPALPSPLHGVSGALFADKPPATSGTWSIELSGGQESRREEDLAPEVSRYRAQTSIAFRRELSPRRSWLRISALGRYRENTDPIAGAGAELYFVDLPLDTLLDLTAFGYTQRFSDGQALNAKLDARLARRFRLSDNLWLVPRLEASASFLNTTPKIAMEGNERGEEIDPDVYTDFRYEHPFGGTGRLEFAWSPFQDFLMTLGGYATSNADFASLDRAGGVFELRALVPMLGETLMGAAYRPGYRFSDEDRELAIWRHDLSASLSWNLWRGDSGRFVISIWNDLSFSSGPTSNAFGLALRYDVTRRRGLIDFQPDEVLFGDLVERRCFAVGSPEPL